MFNTSIVKLYFPINEVTVISSCNAWRALSQLTVRIVFMIVLTGGSIASAGVKVGSSPHQSEYSFPETAALLADGPGSGAICSGVLFKRDMILTAAHCLCRSTPQYVFFGHKVFPEIYESSAWSRKLKVKAIKLYTQDFCVLYNSNRQSEAYQHLDLGLVILEESMDETFPSEYLAQFSSDFDDVASRLESVPAFGAGFGKSDIADFSGLKLSFKIDVDICEPDDHRTMCVDGKELVSTNTDGTDSCEGDSGGPLYHLVDHELKLVAITSRGFGSTDRCGFGGVYTRVDTLDVQKWLNEEI